MPSDYVYLRVRASDKLHEECGDWIPSRGTRGKDITDAQDAGTLLLVSSLAAVSGATQGLSLSETVAFAAEMAEGTITDLYVPKR